MLLLLIYLGDSSGDSPGHSLKTALKMINYGAKVIFGRKKYDHVSDLLRKLRWLSAENLASYHALCAVQKVLRLGEPEELAAGLATVAETREMPGVSGRTTRQDRDLYVLRSRTAMGMRRFTCRGPKAYNELPADLRELPVLLFSRRLRRHLSAQPAASD